MSFAEKMVEIVLESVEVSERARIEIHKNVYARSSEVETAIWDRLKGGHSMTCEAFVGEIGARCSCGHTLLLRAIKDNG